MPSAADPQRPDGGTAASSPQRATRAEPETPAEPRGPAGPGTPADPWAGTEPGAGPDVTGALGLLLDQAPMFGFATDTQLRYTWAAGSIRDQIRAAPDHVGQTAYQLFATTDPGHPGVAPLLAALNGAQVAYPLQRGGRMLNCWAGPLRDNNGRIVGTIGMMVDVTEPESARRREQLAEERFRRLIHHSPALIDIRDAEDRVVHANPAFLRTFAQSESAVLGRTPAEVIPAGGAGELVATARQVRESGRARAWEGQLPHPDGHLVDLLGHVFPLPMADGSTAVGEVFLDVTAQQHYLRALAESEQRYRAIFDSADIAIMLLDLDGRVLDANAATVRMVRRGRSELIGRSAETLASSEQIKTHARSWSELAAGRRSRYDMPLTLLRADGGLVPARLTMTLIRDGAGRPARGLALITPLSPGELPAVPPGRLPTKGESAVLARLAAGQNLQQIADQLGLTRRGVDYRVAQLRRKLRADDANGAPATSAGLVARAYALGILHPSTWPPRVNGPAAGGA